MFDKAILENPYPSYKKWRAEKPIWWDEEANMWVVTRYDDVRGVLKDAATFSSKAMGEGEQRAIALPLLSDDPPRHTELRAIVNRVFTSSALKEMEAGVSELVEALLDEIKGESLVDISDAFTIPLPILIISRLMGIPEERKDDFKRWSDALTGTAEASDMEQRMPDIMEMMGYFVSLIPERRSNPGEDLISKITMATVEGEQLGDQDIAGFCMLLLIAGNETTTNLLSNLLNYLATDYEMWETLRSKLAMS
jgi:cytochrome P450